MESDAESWNGMEDLNLAELSNPVALVNTAALVHLTELESVCVTYLSIPVERELRESNLVLSYLTCLI